MPIKTRLIATCLVAGALAGCAVGQRLGWTGSRADATDRVRASCEEATRTLQGGPDHGTALRACLDAKTRQRVSS